jgi:HK97 family phage portal protein
MLGVPGDSSTYANVESRMIELRTFTLLPWIRRIEACLDAQFPAGTEVKINTDSMLRADTATRYSAYTAALAGGWMTVDEIRALEDRPPLPEQVSTDPVDVMPAIPTEQLPTAEGV